MGMVQGIASSEDHHRIICTPQYATYHLCYLPSRLPEIYYQYVLSFSALFNTLPQSTTLCRSVTMHRGVSRVIHVVRSNWLSFLSLEPIKPQVLRPWCGCLSV